MRFPKEIKVALLVIVAGTILYVGFNYLKGIEFFSSAKTYHIVYDRVEGLSVSDPVRVNGLSIGRVESIELLPESRTNKILVTIAIDRKVKITDSTIAWLTDDGLLGGKSILLRVNRGARIFNEYDTISSAIQRTLSDIIAEKEIYVDSIIYNVQYLLSKLTESNNLGIVLKELAATSQSIHQLIEVNKSNLSGLILNTKDITANLKEVSKDMIPLVQKSNLFVDSLNRLQLVQTVDHLKKIAQDMNSGKGTIGKLLKNDSLYANLNKAIESLNLLLIDVKAKPKRYVHFSIFGRKNK